MSFSAVDYLTRFAQAASLAQALARPERPDDRLEEPGTASNALLLPLPLIFLPPLAPLFRAGSGIDAVLVRGDGIHFDIVLVVDRSARPEHVFAWDAKAIQEAAAEAIALTGRLQGHPLPVKVLVLELHTGDREAPTRLARLKASTGEHKVAVRAASVDLSNGAVWSTSRWALADELVSLLRDTAKRLMAGESDEDAHEDAHEDAARTQVEARNGETGPTRAARPASAVSSGSPTARQRPLATLALLGVMAGMFGAELVVDGRLAWFSPKGSTLVALGALSLPALLRDHAVYRLISCGFLHSGIVHFGLNGLALLLVGSFVERLAGPAWVLVTFMLSLLGGSFLSMAVNRGHSFTVGASGAIMGLIAGGLALTRRMPYGPQRTVARSRLWQWLVPALIPIAFRTGFGTIDVGAHLGGAATGGVLAAWLLRRWDARWPWPQRPPQRVLARIRAGAWVTCAAAVVALGWAVARSPSGLADAALAERLMPDEVANKLADRLNELLRGPVTSDVPADVAAPAAPAVPAVPAVPAEAPSSSDATGAGGVDAELAQLRRTYPHDPRALYVSALWELHQGHEALGAAFLREGLRDSAMLTRAFGDRALEIDMRSHLARTDLRRGDEAQARADLAPVCGLPEPALKEAWAIELCRAGTTPTNESP